MIAGTVIFILTATADILDRKENTKPITLLIIALSFLIVLGRLIASLKSISLLNILIPCIAAKIIAYFGCNYVEKVIEERTRLD